MISGRTLAQGVACESKMSPEFFRANLCPLCLRRERSLCLSEGKNWPIASDFGRRFYLPTRIQAHQWDGLHPYGLWANVPPAAETPSFKCVEVNIEATDSPILGIKELFRDIGRAKA